MADRQGAFELNPFDWDVKKLRQWIESDREDLDPVGEIVHLDRVLDEFERLQAENREMRSTLRAAQVLVKRMSGWDAISRQISKALGEEETTDARS